MTEFANLQDFIASKSAEAENGADKQISIEAKENETKEIEESENEEVQLEDEELQEDDEHENLAENSEDSEEFERKLSGFPKEFKELAKSANDPELRQKIMEAGKIARSREDKLASQLGELKKLSNEALEWMNIAEKNPKAAIFDLAKSYNINLSELTQGGSNDDYEDYDDYLSPEEKALRERLEKQEKNYNQLQSKIQEEKEQIFWDEFENLSSNSEDFPDFQRLWDKEDSSILDFLRLDTQKNGPLTTPRNIAKRIEAAYKKAAELDSEVLKKHELKVITQENQKRKSKIEQAKKLKKVGGKGQNTSVEATDLRSFLRKKGVIG